MKEFAYRAVGAVEQKGRIVKRDFMLLIGEREYKLSVATSEYINSLREYNKRFEQNDKLDDNILSVDSVEDLNHVIERLSEMPWEVVAPYLVEQEEEEEKGL